MPTPEAVVTPVLLRGWSLPDRSGSKDDRGGVLVVGGARRTPGAVALAGLAALRVGAGRLTLAVAGSVAAPLAVAVLEAGVVGLEERADGSVSGDGLQALDAELQRADAVVVGPGLDEPTGAAALLAGLLPRIGRGTALVLDAFALGVLAEVGGPTISPAERVVLTPNVAEAARLLGRDEVDGLTAAHEISQRFGAVVVCAGRVAAPDGRRWASATGSTGLGTSGSGDVLAGAVAGILAGGADAAQAGCWGLALHGTAGDRLAARVGPLGYLARELVDELPAVLVELQA